MAKGFRSRFFSEYAANILPKIQKYEDERKSKYGILMIIEIILVVFSLFVMFILISMFSGSPFVSYVSDTGLMGFLFVILSPLLMIVSLIFIFWLPRLFDKKFKTKLKEACIFDFLPIFGDIRWFNKYLPEPLEIDIGLSELYSFVNCKFEDAFTGVYNNVRYTAAETLLTTYVQTKNGRREVEVFRGIILDFPFNKKVKAHTIIEPKLPNTVSTVGNILVIIGTVVLIALFIFVPGLWHDVWTSKNGIDMLTGVLVLFSSAIAAFIGAKKFKKVKLEDVVFDKDYSVKSEDQVEARYLITPSFMERFKRLGKAYKSKQIKCALFDEHLMFAISTSKDLFEVGSLYHPLSDTRQIEVFYNEISAIFDIIDEFKLNEKIGL